MTLKTLPVFMYGGGGAIPRDLSRNLARIDHQRPLLVLMRSEEKGGETSMASCNSLFKYKYISLSP